MADLNNPRSKAQDKSPDNSETVAAVTGEELSVEQEREALKKAREADGLDITNGEGAAGHGNLHFGEQKDGDLKKTGAIDDAIDNAAGLNGGNAPGLSSDQQNTANNADRDAVNNSVTNNNSATTNDANSSSNIGGSAEETSQYGALDNTASASFPGAASVNGAAAARTNKIGENQPDLGPTANVERTPATETASEAETPPAQETSPENETSTDNDLPPESETPSDSETPVDNELTPSNEAPSDIALSNASIDENDAGAVVATLSTTDPDAGDTASYTLTEDASGLFEIVNNQLRLREGVSLDHEVQDAYSLTIQVEDSAGNLYSETVVIDVNDLNEGPSNVQLSNTSVNENDAGATVGTLSAVDPDAGDSIAFTVSDDRFEVVGNELRVKDGVSFDHETADAIDVTVTATDSGDLESAEAFTINVNDLNEGPSDVQLSNTNINENDAGATVGALSAVDPDAGDSIAFTVSDDRFEIVGNELRVKDGVSFDHETTDAIDVTVTATDTGGLESAQAFTINVNDLNEGPSDVQLSNTDINENDAGAAVGTLSAVDPDAGDSIAFTVSDDRFEVVGNELRVKDGVSFNHETTDAIDVTVTATDSGGLESAQAFTINVADINEGPSNIGLSNTTVDENDAGAAVGTLSAVDPDAGDSIAFTVSDDRFEVVGNELRVKDGVSFDHETTDAIDVTVTATDSGGLENTQGFTINVADVNEGPSNIGLSNTNVNENDAGTTVGTLSAYDPDAGDSITFTVSDDRFEVVGNELRIKDGLSFDHETTGAIDVTVTATDSGGLESAQDFTINVADVNEGPSNIGLSNTSIDENDAGATVGTLSAYDPDAGDSIAFTVSDDRFEVVGKELRVKDGVSFDHETTDAIDVTVTATDSGGIESTQAFTIDVNDLNEGPSDIQLSNTDINENDAGTTVGTLSAVDPDAGDSIAFTVSDDRFEVVGNELRVKDGVSFDHETTDAIDVTVTATDSGGLESAQAFTINVADINEGPSNIGLSNTSVNENDAGATVGTLSAYDPDAGDSIAFTVSDDRFEVVGNELRVKDGISFDHETVDSIDVTVTATDSGGLESAEAFSINVNDLNEGPSDVQLSNTSVNENDAGTTVGTLSAYDPDAGDSIAFTVSDDRFEVVGNELRVKDGVSFDHETTDAIDVTVTATDSGGLESAQAFTINVADVNEGPSDVQLSNTDINENDAGATVGTLSAADPDAGDSIAFTVSDDRFEVVGNELRVKDGVSFDHETTDAIDVTVTATDTGGLESTQAFTINVADVNEGPSNIGLSNTDINENDAGATVGTLSAVDPDAGDSIAFTVSDDRFEVVGNELRVKDGVSFDHESTDAIDVTVTATDSGGLESTQGFTINVADVNEGPQNIELSNSAIDENDAGATVGTLSAVDPDAGDSISFTVSDDRFEVVGNELRVKDGVSFDHETTDAIDVTVTATDSGGLESTQGFTINVSDLNEGPSDVQLSNTDINENEAGAAVGTLSAVDPDAGDSIAFTVSDDRFEVVGNELRVKDGVSFNHETTDAIDVTVTATDSGGLENTQEFTINVADVNEGPSNIGLSNTSVNENDAGTTVGTLSAYDPDASDSIAFTVSDDRFEIVGNELRVKDGVSFDHETTDAIDVTVTATDSGGLESAEAFTINVNDLNEGPSNIGLSNTSVNENDAGTTVGTLSAYDPDASDSIAFTVSDDRFEVVGNELRVKDGVSFDHETTDAIDVTVTATDSGGLESAEAFTINVNDLNEGPSNIGLSNTDINENDAGATVGTLSAYDPDAGDSIAFTVSDDRFEVVGNELRVKDGVSFDHETTDAIDVTVTATDSGGLESAEAFTINVADINEGPSNIGLSNTSVNENDAGATVGTLSAYDPDAGDSIAFTVSDDRFEVAGNELRVKDGVSFDHETVDSIDVTVTATDSSGLESSQGFTIHVNDLNEGPNDVQLSNTNINENHAGAAVGTLSAVDPDAGDSIAFTVSDDRFEVVGNELRVKDGVSFDHETTDAIDVTVTATDSGGLESAEAFTINVADVNEGPSNIGLSNTSVNENDAGATVGTLAAVDPDAGDSISFTVSDDRFEVVGNELRVKDGVSFDHETTDAIDVTVTATDSGGLEDTQGFTIDVNDLNEGPSDVQLSNTTVNENSDGATVGTLSAVDPDAGDSIAFTVSDDRFEVVGNELRVKDGVSFDHETTDAIDVTVTATDSGGLESAQDFTIDVNDLNEGPSLSLGGSQSGLQASYYNVGHELSNLDQIDFDAAPDAEAVVDSLDYMQGNEAFWDGAPDDYFAAKYEGELVVNEGGTYTFNMASDDGSMLFIDGEPVLDNDGLHGTRTRTVSLELDEGSHDIEVRYFENGGSQTLQLEWNGPDTGGTDEIIGGDSFQHGYDADALSVGDDEAGAIVAELAVSDPDAGDTHSFTVDDDRFEVVEDDGAYVLKLKDDASLDFETETDVDVTVTVTDSGGASASQTYSVAVEDANTAPEISLQEGVGLQASYYDVGHSLGNLNQVDFDATPDAEAVVTSLDYQGNDAFWEGAPNDYFAAKYEGKILIEDGGSYTFDLTSDDGSMLFIDGQPVIDNDGLHSADTRSVTLELDEGLHDIEVRYFENNGHQTLQLEWSGPDTGGQQEVIGESAYRLPDFELGDQLGLEENADGDVAAVLSITDADGDAVSYTVDDDRFELVETDDGVALKLKDDVSIDHETTPEIQLTVTATDEHGESTSEDFTIPVADVNEGPTDIELSGTTVSENDTGATVGTLSSTDPDAGDTATYSLAEDASGLFEIVGNELKLKDGASLDYETQDTYDVSVEVTDSGGASYTETMTVNVSDAADANLILGTESGDWLYGGSTADEIIGAGGNDVLLGYGGDDIISGDEGDDYLRGGGDNDMISGGEGRDIIGGDDGDDVIDGGGGNDRMWGGDGSDVFVYDIGDGSDQVYAGSGGGWTDTIQLNDGDSALGDYGVDWTLTVTNGSVTSSDENGFTLSDDADGVISFADGSSIQFYDVEEIII